MTSKRALDLNERGRELAAKGWFGEAERAYRDAGAAEPTWAVPWYNLGLMQKYRHEWAVSLECNLRAAELDPSDQAAWWNFGIAATALERWEEARRAWRACGVSVPDGEGPIEMELGPVPIRLLGDEAPEVVWCTRLDPARAVVSSIPFPASGHGWQDLVLHDGAPNGYRKFRGQDVPVFDELVCLRRSSFQTFIVEVSADSAAMEALSTLAEELGGAAEDWSASIRWLCKECSEATPGHLHDVEHTSPGRPHVGLAARDERHAQEMLSVWRSRWPDSCVHALSAAEVTPSASKHSQPQSD